MRIKIANDVYSKTAILAAVKKQQVFADWRIDESEDGNVALSFSKIAGSVTPDECELRFRQQLDDEQIRERLEKNFSQVRIQLVNAALSPIINMRVE